MSNFRNLAVAFGVSAIALASTAVSAQSADAEALNAISAEGVVSSESSCTYEGGNVLDLEAGKVCFIAVRGEDFNTVAYDNQRLGVIRCSGNGAFANELVQPSGAFCRVFLEQKKVAPSRAEVEAATRAEMENESEASN